MRKLTARELTLGYVSALGLIAVLSIGSHFIFAHALAENSGCAAMMNMTGRQRMLSERITATALQLRLGDESARPLLRAAIQEFSAAHRDLVGMASAPGTDPVTAARLRSVYFGPADIDRQSRLFVAAAEHIADRPEPKAAVIDSSKIAYSPDLQFLVTASNNSQLRGLDQMELIRQQESEARAQKLITIQWAILAVLLVTLLAEALFIFRPMIIRLINYIEQIVQLSENDYLTSLLNRRAFTTRAESEIGRSRRGGHNLAVLLLDVDHFKRINDTHGHLVGDAVLVALARTLSDMARREDIVGRIGGEEFALLLPETASAKALAVAERIRLAVAAHPIAARGSEVAVTISIGWANVPLNIDNSLEAALLSADKMLYRAKGAGRNCVWPQLALADNALAG